MKKSLFIIVACTVVTACNSYTENIKQDILTELTESFEVEKGDGKYFYNEPISIGGEDYFKHHSTLECPHIKNGVQRNCHRTDPYENLFCSHCMDDKLISLWNKEAFPDGYKKK